MIFKDTGLEIRIFMDLEWELQVCIMGVGLPDQKIYPNTSNL